MRLIYFRQFQHPPKANLTENNTFFASCAKCRRISIMMFGPAATSRNSKFRTHDPPARRLDFSLNVIFKTLPAEIGTWCVIICLTSDRNCQTNVPARDMTSTRHHRQRPRSSLQHLEISSKKHLSTANLAGFFVVVSSKLE
jgi:hypothetical protein